MADKTEAKKREGETERKRQEMFANWLYLESERKNAIAEVKRVQKPDSPEMIKWLKDLEFNKEQMLRAKDQILKSGLLTWDEHLRRHEKRKSGDKRRKRQKDECPYKKFKNVVRSLERKIHPNRANLIDERFMENVGRYVDSFEDKASHAEMKARDLSRKIENLKESIKYLADEICNITKDGMLSSYASTREEASKKIAANKIRIEQELKSIEDSKQEILTLQSEASVARAKAIPLRKEMGYTLDSFLVSLERLRERINKKKEHDAVRRSLDSNLAHFENNQRCILELEKLFNDVDSNLPQIREAIEKNSRENMSASFDISTKRVNLFLNKKTNYDITLMEYLHQLKAGTRVSDIQNIQTLVTRICSKITEQIASHSVFDPDVEFLRGRIKHYNELLEEKKRSCM
jgi:hypothetical protein